MQSPTWAELVAALTTRGYHLVFWVEVECAQHGAFRGTAAWDEPQPLCCPRCQQAAEAAFLGRGLTRDGEFPWKCVSPALRPGLKINEEAPLSPAPCGHWGGRKFLARAQAELRELLPLAVLKTRILEHAPPRPRAPRATPVQMQQRIHLVAKLLVQGMTQREIAERAGLDPLSLKVMCCRRKAELQTAVSELKSMGSLMP